MYIPPELSVQVAYNALCVIWAHHCAGRMLSRLTKKQPLPVSTPIHVLPLVSAGRVLVNTNEKVRVLLLSNGVLRIEAKVRGRLHLFSSAEDQYPTITTQDLELIAHFVRNSDAFLEERIALRARLIDEIEAWVRIGVDPETRAVRCFRESQ